MRRKYLLLCFLFSIAGAQAQTFQVDTITKTGPLNKRINLVYLGDGYTAVEQSKFIADVIAINNQLFNTVPFNRYKEYFNVFAIRVISVESGVKHARTASDCPSAGSHPVSNPNNYFGTRFDVGSIHRLVAPSNMSLMNTVLAFNFPEYDQALLVANTSFYGGSGGTVATSTTNFSAAEIMIHEIGHSFASLADEYWAGPQYATEKPNMTQQSSASLVKWKNWIGSTGIGVFPFSGGPGWFKPANATCKMELLNRTFCAVCTETFVERIHTLAPPLDSYFPSNAGSVPVDGVTGFKINTINPFPNTMRVRWNVNGLLQAQNTDTFTLAGSSLSNGNHNVLVSIADTTELSRADNHLSLHTYNVSWNISIITGISEPEIFKAALRIFPNPFANDLVVQYELEKRARIGIQLVAADGRRVQLLDERNQQPGLYRFPFSLREKKLSPGVYFAVFTINGATVARELIRLE